MNTDWAMIINLGWGAMLAAVGWFVRILWEAVQKIKADLHRLEVHLPTAYVDKTELRTLLEEIKTEQKEDIKELKALIQKIDTKLDTKS
jgi:hypothetical protein